MSLTDKVTIELEVGTLSVLISGLYVSYTGIHVNAIPVSMYMEVAEKVAEYLPQWDYSRLSLEDWIRTSLIIAPKELFSEEELDYYKDNNLFLIQRIMGNAIIIATGEAP